MTLEGEPQHITNDLGSHDNDDKLEGQYCDPQADSDPDELYQFKSWMSYISVSQEMKQHFEGC